MAFLRQQLSFDKTGIKESAPCPVFARALVCPEPANRADESSGEPGIWLPHGNKRARDSLRVPRGVVSVWIMHRAAEIQQRCLRLTQKKTNKILTGTKRCSKHLQCHPRKIQNKVIKGKLICLEHCSGITGFRCRNLLPEESYQF